MPSAFQYLDPALLTRLANLNLVARLVVEGFISGLHKSPYQGFSVEFAEYRKYCPGDNLRYLDWKVLAKSDRYYIKRFQEETNLKSMILLDASGSMGYASGSISKLQYACYAAASLAYLMIRQQDSVGLAAFDSELQTYLVPRSHPRHLKDILLALERQKAGRETDLQGVFNLLAQRLKRRGLIIILSDLFDHPESVMRALAHFRHKKHEVIVFHILDACEKEFPFKELVEFEDLETGERLPIQPRLIRESYLKEMERFCDTYRTMCGEHKIDFVPLVTNAPLDVLLINYLSKRSRLG
ncbi:DUF58 domain-containing protein [Candidatus Sumerlaeota bacterium]|nr:DUF58 domain-containing protein [Candidatus Sumerlaeota bacterium]